MATCQASLIEDKAWVVGSSLHAPTAVLCLGELACCYLQLGAPLERQANVPAVDGVTRYGVQLHRAHGPAETCGAALPGELFPHTAL